MRSDFGKVIIDCRRGGGGISAKKARKGRWRQRSKDPDTAPKREPMSMSRGTKWFCDRLGPLRRYLEKQVGRPWDKVWSEICANIPAGGIMQQHVRSHVFDFVVVKTMLVDGRVYGVRDWRPEPIEEMWSYRSLLYVCPRTGLLRRRTQSRRPRWSWTDVFKRGLRTPDGRPLEKIGGLWFVWEERTVRVRENGYVEKRTELRKRQLSKKEIAAFVR